MKTAGIIAEYNPFHNGHKHQLDEVKKRCDAVIAVMSGHFTQRGDVAVTDKWTRAKAAAVNGCDLVLELPIRFSLSSAEDFARGGVLLLDKLGITDYLYFGAECGDTEKLTRAAKMLLNEGTEISSRIKEYVSDGMSYPSAYTKAYDKILDADIISMPNNILAVEYIKALLLLGSNITPVAMPRIGARHDSEPVGNIASASHIRKLIKSGDNYSKYVPEAAYKIYQKSDMSYSVSRLDAFITGTLRTLPAEHIAAYASEGLENRVKTAANERYGFESICAAVKSKRYTLSRVRRIILSAVLSVPKDKSANYARVLAMNDTGKALLKEIKKKSDITIITKTADYKGGAADADIRATDIFSMCSAKYENRVGGRDYITSPVIL